MRENQLFLLQLERRDLLKLEISAAEAIALLTLPTPALPPISAPSIYLLSPVATPPFVLQPQLNFANKFYEGLAAAKIAGKSG